jgi:hypothetical protein
MTVNGLARNRHGNISKIADSNQTLKSRPLLKHRRSQLPEADEVAAPYK